MDIVVFVIYIVAIIGAFESLNSAVPIVALSIVITSIYYFGFIINGKNKVVFLLFYILSIPLLAAYDRYWGIDYLNEIGYILRIGLTQFILVIVSAGMILYAIIHRRKIFQLFTTIDYHLLALAIYIVLSYALQSDKDPIITQRFFGWIPYYILIFIIARMSLTKTIDAYYVLTAIEISVCTVIISRYLYQSPLAFLEGLYRIEVNYIYLSAVIYSQILVLVLPIAYNNYKRDDKYKIYYLILLILLISEIIFTQTRGAYLAAASSIGYYSYRSERTSVKINIKTVMGVILVVLFIGIAQVFISLREINQGGVEGSTAMRGLIMAYYFNEFLQNIWFGAGYGSEGVKSLYIEGSHNSYLSLSYDLGLVGLIIVTAIFVRIFKVTNRMSRQYPDVKNIVLVIQSCLISQIVFGMTTGNNILYSIPMQIIFMVIIIVSLVPSLQWINKATEHRQSLPAS